MNYCIKIYIKVIYKNNPSIQGIDKINSNKKNNDIE